MAVTVTVAMTLKIEEEEEEGEEGEEEAWEKLALCYIIDPASKSYNMYNYYIHKQQYITQENSSLADSAVPTFPKKKKKSYKYD